MWAAALETEAFRAATRGAAPSTAQAMLRLFGIPESEIAETLRGAEATGIDSTPLEITTCLRRGEIEIVDALRARRRDGLRGVADVVRERHAGDAVLR